MYNTKGRYKTTKNNLDDHTREIMSDRIRYQQKHDKMFHEFLDTIDWKREAWIEKYDRSEDAIRDLLDLWYEVDQV